MNIYVALTITVLISFVQGQECSFGHPCPNEFPCCSRWGFCGNTEAWCGTDCICGCSGRPSCNGSSTSDHYSSEQDNLGPSQSSSLSTVSQTSATSSADSYFLVNFSRSDNVILYWGQNVNEGPLRDFCMDSTYDIIILAFLYAFPNPISVNFAGHCETTFSDRPTLLNCTGISEDIKYCKSQGKTILLSIGGAVGWYYLSNWTEAMEFASSVWNMFLGGKEKYRPFGDAALDGIDLDIEIGSHLFYADFANKLRAISEGKVIIGAAPQCPYADTFLGPDGETWNGYFHNETALSNSVFDFVTVQFYNNANYCNLGESGFRNGDSSFERWHNWTLSTEVTALFVGTPSSSNRAGSGYVSDSILKEELLFASKFKRFGGLTLWDAFGVSESGRGAWVSPWLKSLSPSEKSLSEDSHRPSSSSSPQQLSSNGEGSEGESSESYSVLLQSSGSSSEGLPTISSEATSISEKLAVVSSEASRSGGMPIISSETSGGERLSNVASGSEGLPIMPSDSHSGFSMQKSSGSMLPDRDYSSSSFSTHSSSTGPSIHECVLE